MQEKYEKKDKEIKQEFKQLNDDDMVKRSEMREIAFTIERAKE